MHEDILDYRDFVLISPDSKYEWHPYGGMSKNCVEALKNITDIDEYRKREIRKRLDMQREWNTNYKALIKDEINTQIYGQLLPYNVHSVDEKLFSFII